MYNLGELMNKEFALKILQRLVSEDRAFPGEYLWIYETEMGITYYIKCKFSSDLSLVKFVSFHPALYH